MPGAGRSPATSGSTADGSTPWSLCCRGLEPPGPGSGTSTTSRCSSARSTTCRPTRTTTWSWWWACSSTWGRDRRISEPQRAFLGQIEGVLRPGGSLLLAIENRLGVKYLAGAGEDHTGRVYDSVEGYPAGTIARTFSRSELTGLLESAGLDPSFYGAFPDYKLPRAVLSDALFASVPPLAWRIPQFPSPDRVGRSSRALNEERLWRALVQDGLGANFGNSFVVVARKGPRRGEGDDLWPLGQLAAFYQPDRRAAYATQTLVCERDGTTVFGRSPLRPVPAGSSLPLGGLQDAERVHEESALVRGHGPSRGARGCRRRSSRVLLAPMGRRRGGRRGRARRLRPRSPPAQPGRGRRRRARDHRPRMAPVGRLAGRVSGSGRSDDRVQAAAADASQPMAVRHVRARQSSTWG